MVNYPYLVRHIWKYNKCKWCVAGCSAYLLNFAMKILMWLKSARSAGSSAQQLSIKMVSSSQCRLLSVVGLKYGFWPFRTFWIISVTKNKIKMLVRGVQQISFNVLDLWGCYLWDWDPCLQHKMGRSLALSPVVWSQNCTHLLSGFLGVDAYHILATLEPSIAFLKNQFSKQSQNSLSALDNSQLMFHASKQKTLTDSYLHTVHVVSLHFHKKNGSLPDHNLWFSKRSGYPPHN